LIIPIICASVKRLFRIRLLFQGGHTLHQTEGTSGGQVTLIAAFEQLVEFIHVAAGYIVGLVMAVVAGGYIHGHCAAGHLKLVAPSHLDALRNL
jgi:hypothetical protein